jgi:hypothetical protein
MTKSFQNGITVVPAFSEDDEERKKKEEQPQSSADQESIELTNVKRIPSGSAW